MNERMDSTICIVDQIYEAALIPERWANVCESMSAEVNSYSASVITIGEQNAFRWISSANILEKMAVFAESPLRFENIRAQRHMQLSPFSFLRDQDLMSEAELASDPIYNEFLRPIGLGWTMGDAIQEPSGHVIIFDIIRQSDRGPFSREDIARLNRIKPDLARAALMSSRLSFQQANTVTKALSSIGLPAAVIGERGEVVAMNEEMGGVSPRIRTGAGDHILVEHPSANALLRKAFNQLNLGLSPSTQSIPIAAGFDTPPLVLHLIPVKREARDIFSRGMAILLATPVGQVGPPDLRVICGLFDLTPSEARVAREIAVGTPVNDIAQKLGLARETIRTYIKSLFSKTGTSKQSQLAILLSGLGTVSR